MVVEEALRLLEREDEKVRHVYREEELRELFGIDSDELGETINALEEEGILQHAALDVYEYKQSKHRGIKTFYMIVQALRPNDIVYESLESSAGQWGIISQIATILTCMTTGESGFYRTCLGDVEFAHTDASPDEIRANIVNRDEFYEIPIATEEYTEHDLRMLDRSIDLLEEQRIKMYGGVINNIHYFPCVEDDSEQIQERREGDVLSRASSTSGEALRR